MPHRIGLIIAALCFVAASAFVLVTPSHGLAQDADATAPAPADAAPAPAANAPAPTTTPPQENMLIWLVKTSGWIGAVILALSIYFVMVVVRGFLDLKEEEDATKIDLEACENLLKAKDLGGLFKLVKQETSFFGTVLTEGLTELQYGLDDAREAVDRVGDAKTIEMEKRISMLAVLGSLGPMIGLLGTLKGMISSFSAIAQSGTQMKADVVAHGISEALVLTFEGVALSVPAIYFFAYFRNRISKVSSDAMLAIHDFLRRVHNQIRTAKQA
jgi:biopolymer transport protein ExbB